MWPTPNDIWGSSKRHKVFFREPETMDEPAHYESVPHIKALSVTCWWFMSSGVWARLPSCDVWCLFAADSPNTVWTNSGSSLMWLVFLLLARCHADRSCRSLWNQEWHELHVSFIFWWFDALFVSEASAGFPLVRTKPLSKWTSRFINVKSVHIFASPQHWFPA